MKLYIVRSHGSYGYWTATAGVFTSLESADKAVKEWCESQGDDWKHYAPSHLSGCDSYYNNETRRGDHSITIDEFDSNRLAKIEHLDESMALDFLFAFKTGKYITTHD